MNFGIEGSDDYPWKYMLEIIIQILITILNKLIILEGYQKDSILNIVWIFTHT